MPEQGTFMNRVVSVDLARGLVMIIMALDHVRDFWSPSSYAMLPVMDPSIPPEWYFTRWITHLCAPVFILLAGTSARFYQVARDASDRELSRFLLTRGLWLIAVELVIVNWSWQFGFGFSFVQVIWAIGVSMIVLAGLIHLPRWAVLAFGLILVFAHNLFDSGGWIGPPVEVGQPVAGVGAWLWVFLHQGGFGRIAGHPLYVAYPLIPWIGVMALGYVLADRLRDADGMRFSLRLGLGAIGLFLVLRGINVYGDPSPWSSQEAGWWYTVQSFLNVSKYPPSLDFLLVTLGISLAAMPALERFGRRARAVMENGGPARALDAAISRLSGWITVYGRVPFFYYVLHVPLIHASARLYYGWGEGSWMFTGGRPEGYEPQLWLSYAAWAGVILVLYLPCRWYADLKRRRDDWWLSYL